MKKLCYSAFIAFWSCIATIIAIQALANNDADQTGGQSVFTLADIAKHATEDDCWMAIEQKVYDLTDYLPKHPAGPATMLPWCGSEATEGMRSKGIGSDHSDFAWKQLDGYLVGTLKK